MQRPWTPCTEARALMACSRLSSKAARRGYQGRCGSDELPGTGASFFARSGMGTETLETLAGYILLLGHLSGPAHSGVSTLPNEFMLDEISLSFQDISGHHWVSQLVFQFWLLAFSRGFCFFALRAASALPCTIWSLTWLLPVLPSWRMWSPLSHACFYFTVGLDPYCDLLELQSRVLFKNNPLWISHQHGVYLSQS